MRMLLWFAVVAFVLGIGVTALFVRQYRQWLPRSAQMMFDGGADGAAGSAPASGGSATGTGETGFVPPPEAGAAARSIDNDMLNARQVAIAAQLATLEARTITIDQESRAAASNSGRAEALLIAFAARRAIDRGLGLGEIEGPLKRRFRTTQARAVATVVAAGRAPVTLQDLRLSLDTMAPELTSGVAVDGWVTSFQRELAGLIVIRHEGTASPRATDRLARVRHLLDAGKVDAALAEVGRLPGAQKAKTWMTAAGRYVETQAALDAIETEAIVGQHSDMTGTPAQPTASGQAGTETRATAVLTP